MNATLTTASIAGPFSDAYTSVNPGLGHYRPEVWTTYPSTFVGGLRAPWAAASKVWHEAQWLDVLHDAYALNDSLSGLSSPVELSAHERDVEAARRQAEALGATFAQREKLRAIVTERRDAQAALATAQEQIAQLRSEVNTLRYEQITDGSDDRLTDFWERAAEKASNENYCGEYDRMAELLGGPGRSRTWNVEVEVTLTVTVQVEAHSEDEAMENADEWGTDDMERHIAGLDYYDLNVTNIDSQSANDD